MLYMVLQVTGLKGAEPLSPLRDSPGFAPGSPVGGYFLTTKYCGLLKYGYKIGEKLLIGKGWGGNRGFNAKARSILSIVAVSG